MLKNGKINFWQVQHLGSMQWLLGENEVVMSIALKLLNPDFRWYLSISPIITYSKVIVR